MIQYAEAKQNSCQSSIFMDKRDCWQEDGQRLAAFTLDVEDYYQVSAFENLIDRSHWSDFSSRVQGATQTVLELLDQYQMKGTFFTLGIVAQQHPDLIRQIAAAGHEIAAHGWAHHRVWTQTPEEFLQDITRTRTLLQDLSGQPVYGYRAASFSIRQDCLWAFAQMEKAGYRYSSSINPIMHDHYGIPDAPQIPFRPAGCEALWEIPITTIDALGRRWPAGGGGYFRLMPYPLFRFLWQKWQKQQTSPAIFYAHPWEYDPEQPLIKGLPWKTRFRHYVGLSGMLKKTQNLLRDFPVTRMDKLFLED